MSLIEYLNKITDNGTKCALPDEVFHQRTDEQYVGDGVGGRSGYTILKYTSESISEQKRELKLLKAITMRAMNCKCDNASIFRLWNALMIIVPKDFRNGDYNSELIKIDFKHWLMMFTDTICMELSTKMITERNCPGARYWLTTLQTRMDSWQKQVKMEEDSTDGNKNVTISFSGF